MNIKMKIKCDNYHKHDSFQIKTNKNENGISVREKKNSSTAEIYIYTILYNVIKHG